MKNKSIKLLTAFSLFLLCICCGNNELVLTPDPESQSKITIHSIADLNMRASVIDSHKNDKNNVLEMDFRRKVELKSELSCVAPFYPRVKKLTNGQYILLYMDGAWGPNIYYALSKDMLTWSNSRPLFTPYPHGNNDTRYFACADAAVLHNGDIVVACCFRDLNGYSSHPEYSGLMMRRSSNNGQTWTDEYQIYQGSCWEPYLLQLPSGELQVYFTDNDPTPSIRNSGSSILRSFNSGQTWTPALGELPIRVVHQYTYTNQDNIKIFTGQMISTRLLHDNKTIAVVCESRNDFNGTNMCISYCNSTDNWAKSIGQNEEGPANHQWNVMTGVGPYLALFPSGESVLSYSARIGGSLDGHIILRIGGVTANDFDKEVYNKPFPNAPTIWGSMELDDPHTLIVAAPNFLDGNDYTKIKKASLLLGKMTLNHRINAPTDTPTLDGDNADWKDNTDAFFLGSDSRSQATFRFAHDNDNLYLLIERLDDYLTDDDAFSIMLNNGSKTLKFKINYNKATNTLITDNPAIECKSFISGTFNDGTRDKGCIAELAIPVSQLSLGQKVFFNAVLHDKDVNDGFNGLTENVPAKWLPITLD